MKKVSVKRTPKRHPQNEETPINPRDKWGVRGVEAETIAIIKKAAKRQKKSVGEYFNTTIRAAATEEIKGSKPEQLPIKAEDVADILADIRADIAALKAAKEKKRFKWF